MAKRGRKPQDPRTPEEIAAQKRKKGLKQPGIVGARKKIAAEKKAKRDKGAAIEAGAAGRRKKSTPRAPKAAVNPPTEADVNRILTEPEAPKPKRPNADIVDDPKVRAANRNRSERQRLAQIGNPDALTAAERLAMQEIRETTPTEPVTKDTPALKAGTEAPVDPLRPKVEPLPEEVRYPFATSGAFTFQGPRPVPGGEVPTAERQSWQEDPKIGKDLVRRISKGLGLPGPKNIKQRAEEIAQGYHARAVERGMAHPDDVPTLENDTTILTGHPLRQATVEHLYSATEDQLKRYSSARGVNFHDTVHGLFNLAQQSEFAPYRVKLDKETKAPVLYNSADPTETPGTHYDKDFASWLISDVHKPRPNAPSPTARQVTQLKAKNILEEVTGPKLSGSFSGKAKGGVAPIGPMPMQYDKEGNPTEPARSGVGPYAPEDVKDLPPKKGKKAKGFGGGKDSQGGPVPGPTANQKVVRSNQGKRATGASSPTYRLQEPDAATKSTLETPKRPSQRFINKEVKKERRSKGRLAMAIKSGDDAAIQNEAFKRIGRGAQFTQTELPFFSEPEIKGLGRSQMEQLTDKVINSFSVPSNVGERVLLKTEPKVEKYSEVKDKLPYSGFSAVMDRPQFGTRIVEPKPTKVRTKIKANTPPIERPSAPTVESENTGNWEQPFLTPSVPEKQLRELFPRDFDTSGGKKKNTWNPMSRQFLPGKEVKVSPETADLQSQASMARGKKDTPFEPQRRAKNPPTEVQ